MGSLLLISASVVLTNATAEVLLSPPLTHKQTVRWDRIVGRDYTNTGTRTELVLSLAGNHRLLKAGVQAHAGDTLNTDTPVYATGDWRVGVIVYGGTDGDVIELAAYGEVVE